VDAIGLDLEGEVGSVVQDERHGRLRADPGGKAAPIDQGAGVEVLVS